ncbi:MAG: AAA family ATPase [Sphaerochaeta sp.]|jgi:putative ATPase|nr:AAA family ATPase [Sphaerochaeta sp.]MCI2096567.1 AAA family ATPase [Sphaerochaeta sp.]MCI2105009.1 AAA family ATPase [Sphaerochaeta sp.]
MTLFDQPDPKNQPLAFRMRPRTLDEYIGQEEIVGKGRLLRRAIQADQLSSVIFYGPPGTGKTTLARVIANTTKRHFSTLNAVLTGVKELRDEIAEAKNRIDHFGQGTILFVDEVHRWNKSQQDALLPWVENGTVIFIGATTENPFFEVNAALVSRSRIFQLKPLTDANLMDIARQALSDKERGYGSWDVRFEPGALEHLVEVANGDARSLLNALQLAVETSVEPFPPPIGSVITISKEAAEESIQKKVVLYDKEGDYHFDVISAFIKSLRGSDPDAALYWLAKMVAAGEDPRFIFRRMLISACEDIGLADPNAIVVVEADAAAFDRIGLPEGRFHLTHAALYLATAPKSNSALAFFDALKTVEEENSRTEVPNHLRDPGRDAKGFGHGEGYLYPHAYQDHWVAQQYLPTSLQGKLFYQPGTLGYEAKIHDQVQERREEQIENAAVDAAAGENLTFSPGDKERERWVQRTMGQRGAVLKAVRDMLYAQVTFLRNDRVLVLGGGYGLLLWPAYKETPEGLVVAQVGSVEEKEYLEHSASALDPVSRPMIIQCAPCAVFSHLEPGLRFEKVIGRNILTHLSEDKGILATLTQWMAPKAVMVLAQTIPSGGSRLSDFVTDKALSSSLKEAEQAIYQKGGTSLSDWGVEELQNVVEDAGLYATITVRTFTEQRLVTKANLASWLRGGYQSCASHQAELEQALCGHPLSWKHQVACITASMEQPTPSRKKDAKGTQAWKETEAKTHTTAKEK